MTRKRRFGNSRDSYSPYRLLVLISLVSLALAGCSRASPRAEEDTTPDPDMTTEISPQSTVTILADSATVVAGDPVSYTVNAFPAPTEDLTVHVEFTGVELAADPPATITIGAGLNDAMFTVQTAKSPAGTITASVAEGDGYTVGTPRSAPVTVTASSTGPTEPVIISPPPPVIISPPPPANSVIITAVADSVVEGNPVQFTVTAEPAPAEDLTLSVSVTQTTPERAPGNLPTSATIMQSTSSTELTLTTTDDGVTQSAGTVTATLTGVASGPATYSIGSPASATVTITDNDQSIATIGLPASVSPGAVLTITVNMSPALAVAQTIGVAVRDYGPPAPEPALVAVYHIELNVGATSGTAAHTVATEYGNADDRIRVEIFNPAPDSPYVRGSPYVGSVDVS